MSGTDIFVAVLSVIMLFGGLYLNFTSRKLSNSYAEAHKVENSTHKAAAVKSSKVSKKK